MELNREQIIKELEGLAKFKTCPEYIKNSLALIKELTEENKAWQEQLISQEEKAGKAYYDLACEVEDLRAENANLHTSCTELTQECKKWQGRLKIECEYTKADTVRKMQERLKTEAYPFPCAIGVEYAVPYCKIDQIAKEMIEGETK